MGRSSERHCRSSLRPPGDTHTVRFHYIRENDEWRFNGASQMCPMKFKTLERKVTAFLPRDFPRRFLDPLIVIVEIGPDGVDAAQASRLEERLRKFGEQTSKDLEVVFEVSSDLPFFHLILALDSAILAKNRDCSFVDTTTTGRPPPGIRVNGVPLEDLDELPPVPEHHPALRRIIMIR